MSNVMERVQNILNKYSFLVSRAAHSLFIIVFYINIK